MSGDGPTRARFSLWRKWLVLKDIGRPTLSAVAFSPTLQFSSLYPLRCFPFAVASWMALHECVEGQKPRCRLTSKRQISQVSLKILPQSFGAIDRGRSDSFCRCVFCVKLGKRRVFAWLNPTFPTQQREGGNGKGVTRDAGVASQESRGERCRHA